jgi:hypothetical protein
VTFRHIVLLRVRSGTEDDAVDVAVRALEAALRLSAATSWQLAPSLDARKGRMIVEDVTFEDRASFELFRDSHEHRMAAALWSSVADWWVGDYEPGPGMSRVSSCRAPGQRGSGRASTEK